MMVKAVEQALEGWNTDAWTKLVACYTTVF